jgi:transposase
MHIPQTRTRRDMERAAELRAGGASWKATAEAIGRHEAVLRRWAKDYSDDWERLYRDADERLKREANNESRAMLRTLLRHKSSKIRLSAADKLSQLILKSKAVEPPPDPRSDLRAFEACLESMTDEELELFMCKFIEGVYGKPLSVRTDAEPAEIARIVMEKVKEDASKSPK